MTLKEELEILRGEPIQVFDGDPMDIPCIETSDPEKLCKHPVVSVHMITYNHEPYIRQAIESVMMQKTDFEFELVIGEDCSQDKTREICFEYQKKYPDKIRVLWWHENVSNLGGNGRRVRAHCRGEFIAFCEGDDYWTSPDKLQLQFNAFESNSDVGLVATSGIVVDSNGRLISHFVALFEGYTSRQCVLDKILRAFWFGVLTCGVMCRRDVMTQNLVRLAATTALCLKCGDIQFELAILDTSNAYFIKEEMVAYRRSATSVTGNPRSNFAVGRDGILVRYAYASIKTLRVERERIMRWYIDYMSISGFRFLPVASWYYWLLKNDAKFFALWRIAKECLRRFLKCIAR